MAKQKKDYVVKTDPTPRVQPENLERLLRPVGDRGKEGDYYTTYMAKIETLIQRQPTFATYL